MGDHDRDSSSEVEPADSTDDLALGEDMDVDLLDEAASDDTVVPHRYDITSFGADYDVEGLVARLNRDEIFIPTFQREFVWSQKEASRFIESLLLGLPVPGVILAREPDTNRLLVLDGQQRLKTLQFFYGGYFNPRADDRHRRVFKLVNVQEQYAGKTYADLSEADRVHLGNSIIHATIAKQDAPAEDDTSIYHIFERLNSSGRRLFPHEIRLAIYYGALIDLLKDLNQYGPWREIFGKRNRRLKDQELILRFLALYTDHEAYRRPMAEFLNAFTKRHRNPPPEQRAAFERLFRDTIATVHRSLGTKAFRPQAAINAAIYDAVMVAVARRLEKGPIESPDELRAAYEALLSDEGFTDATSRSTSDTAAVAKRLRAATNAFADVV